LHTDHRRSWEFLICLRCSNCRILSTQKSLSPDHIRKIYRMNTYSNSQLPTKHKSGHRFLHSPENQIGPDRYSCKQKQRAGQRPSKTRACGECLRSSATVNAKLQPQSVYLVSNSLDTVRETSRVCDWCSSRGVTSIRMPTFHHPCIRKPRPRRKPRSNTAINTLTIVHQDIFNTGK